MIPKDKPHITISNEEQQRILTKKAARLAAREHFIKEMANPFKYIHAPHMGVPDMALDRVEAQNTFASHIKFFRPTARRFGPFFFSFILPVTVLYNAIDYERSTFDAKCRRGEIAYRDRNFKFG